MEPRWHAASRRSTPDEEQADGTVGERRSYGGDPHPPTGSRRTFDRLRCALRWFDVSARRELVPANRARRPTA
jgi:hypothetical protein